MLKIGNFESIKEKDYYIRGFKEELVELLVELMYL